MSDYPPFMNSYGKIREILEAAKSAKTPDRFTHDYLSTVLGHSGGSSRPFVAFAKRLGLLNSDGTPTELYKRFRNPAQSKAALADAVRHGYSDLFRRNEFAYKLPREKLEGLLIEMTGLEDGDTTLRAIVRSFQILVEMADFEAPRSGGAAADGPKKEESHESDAKPKINAGSDNGRSEGALPLGLSYSINVVLPNTDDASVFNAIFRALRENLINP